MAAGEPTTATTGECPQLRTTDLLTLAAALSDRAFHGLDNTHAASAPVDIRTYLGRDLPGSATLETVPGSLGRALRHTLLWSWSGSPWPYLERWDLDRAVDDPVAHYFTNVPKWLFTALAEVDPEVHESIRCQRQLVRPRPFTAVR